MSMTTEFYGYDIPVIGIDGDYFVVHQSDLEIAIGPENILYERGTPQSRWSVVCRMGFDLTLNSLVFRRVHPLVGFYYLMQCAGLEPIDAVKPE